MAVVAGLHQNVPMFTGGAYVFGGGEVTVGARLGEGLALAGVDGQNRPYVGGLLAGQVVGTHGIIPNPFFSQLAGAEYIKYANGSSEMTGITLTDVHLPGPLGGGFGWYTTTDGNSGAYLYVSHEGPGGGVSYGTGVSSN